MKKKHLHLIKGKRKKERTPGQKKLKKSLICLLIVILVFFTVRSLFSFILSRAASYYVKTHIIEEELIEDKFLEKGLVIRDEKVVTAPQSGYLLWGIPEGSRIGVGKVAAELVQELPQEEGDNESEKERIDAPFKDSAEINNNGIYKESNTYDPIEIEYRTSVLVNRLRASISKGNMQDAQKYYEELKSLSQEQLIIRSSVHSTGSQVMTSFSGIIVYFTDGLEGLFHSNNIEFLSVRQIEDIEANPRRINFGEKIEKGLPIFKIVDNYSWYFTVSMTSYQTEILRGKKSVNLKFAFAPREEVRAEVYNIKEEKEGYMVTFIIREHIQNFYIQRESEAEIIYNRYRGITVPVEAVVYKDDEPGVYSLEKAAVRFHPVKVIRQIGEKILLEDLSPGQCIITNPRLYREGQYIPWRGDENMSSESL